MKSLKGKRIWLTGASKGIGRAVALELASRGAVCGLTSRDRQSLDELRGDIERRSGEVVVVVGDVTDLDLGDETCLIPLGRPPCT